MRHLKKGRILGRNPSHRKATMRNMAVNLIEHRKIKTTDAKAKELRRFIEPLVTKARNPNLNTVRQLMKILPRKDAVHKLVHEIAPEFADRPGGYTRITKLGFRDNDRAPVSLIEFVGMNGVDASDEADSKPKKKSKGDTD